MSESEPPSMTPAGDARAAFAELSRIELDQQPLGAVLGRVAALAKQTIPQVTEASVTLLQGGTVATVVFTGQLAVDLDERQYDTGLGPCVAAAVSGSTILIPDTATDPSFPDFARAAARRGITTVLAISLPLGQHASGALNLYGSGQPFDEAAIELVRNFADYAAVAVANAGAHARATDMVGHLQRALESRAVIDQAKGILMARHHLSAEAAFTLLAEESQRSNRKVRELASELVEQVQRGTEN